ncbi:MAG: response regulator, partial [Erysipelotrichaceae bacterium]|nr:response regulator [Erysipelotrichaceae bacterium]
MSNFYPVMLVEEKEHMIKLISNMLPWKSYGFEIVSVANGEDRALAYYGEYKHKIVFTAIDLKRGNGISLIKQLRYLDQSLIIVVISNHDDYDNIRNAFKAGANDYLIKARLRYGDIASILEQAKVNLAQDNNEEQAENWCQKLESYLGLIRDKQKIDDALVYDIIRKQTEFILLNEPYRIIYFRMDNIRNFNRTTRQYDKPSWMSTEEFITMFQNRLLLRDQIQYKLKVIIEDYFKDVPKAFVIFSKKHSGLIILPDHDIEWLKEKTFNLLQLIFGTILCEFSATISTTYQGIDGFVDHYKDITNYHDHKFYDGDMCLELMDDDKKYEHLHDIDDHFLALIDNQLYDEIIPLKNKIITEMVAYNIYPQEVKDYFCTLITKIEKMILRKDISMNYPFDI